MDQRVNARRQVVFRLTVLVSRYILMVNDHLASMMLVIIIISSYSAKLKNLWF